MGNVNKRVVQHRTDGRVEVRAPGADRASAVVETQAEGISRAREILSNTGGGELQVRGKNGSNPTAGHDRTRQRSAAQPRLTAGATQA